jgi:hypothetical protein
VPEVVTHAVPAGPKNHRDNINKYGGCARTGDFNVSGGTAPVTTSGMEFNNLGNSKLPAGTARATFSGITLDTPTRGRSAASGEGF